MSAGLKPLNARPFYNEFVMQAPLGSGKKILLNLLQNGFLGGLDLGEDKMLICCTEINQIEDIVSFASIVKETLSIK
jgi:glycine dehydrogenase subunit 1